MSALVIKIAFGEQIRRLSLDNGTPSYAEVSKIIAGLFDGLPEKWALQYKDDEGDVITVSSEREFQDAIQLLKKSGTSIRFNVFGTSKPSNAPNQPSTNPMEFLTGLLQGLGVSIEVEQPNAAPFHPFFGRRGGCPRNAWAQGERKETPDFHRANCDGCNKRIPATQTRFKCNDCPDFDFCETCRFTVPHHGTHTFVEIKDPKLTVHAAVCDACNLTIVGDRFKCRECPDYDLCSKCYENKTKFHAEHPFVKLERPWGAHGIPFGCRRFGGCPRPQQDQQPQSNNNAAPSVPKVVIPNADQPKKEEPKVVIPQPESAKKEEVKPIEKEEPKKPFENEIKLLKEMGFLNEEINLAALKEAKGDVTNAVRRLLGM